jgi:hypothetical protein
VVRGSRGPPQFAPLSSSVGSRYRSIDRCVGRRPHRSLWSLPVWQPATKGRNTVHRPFLLGIARRASPAAGVSILILILASTGIVSASIPDANGEIHACVVTRTGALRVIDSEVAAPATCTSKETALSWSRQGPAGQDGAPGPAGSVSATYVRRVASITGPIVVEATCDAGDFVTGGGGETDGVLEDSYPYVSGFGSDVPVGWRAKRSGGTTVAAYVVCADATP